MKIGLILLVAVIAVAFLIVLWRAINVQLLTGNREQDLARLRPRLVTQKFLEANEAKLKKQIPSRPFFDTGLNMVYVLDNPRTVVYVTQDMLEPLELSESELHKLALDNLRGTFPQDAMEKMVGANQMSVIKMLDGHDAAMLILLPDYLSEGELVAVTIPDNDTLTICTVPEDWASLRKLATKAASRPLFDKPLLVGNGSVKVVN